jgi:MerR family copper efflux transcriptional regulator
MVGMTIGQLARAVQVNVQTVRFYERRGLVMPILRKTSGYRIYSEEAVRRLRFIRNAQQLGFTLKEIAALLDLRVSSAARCGTVQVKALAKLEQVQHKVHQLQSLARVLRELVQSCRAGETTEHCPILNSLEPERSDAHGKRQTTR